MDSIEDLLNDMTGVGEDKDYMLKMFSKLEEENEKLRQEVKALKKKNKEPNLVDFYVRGSSN